MTLDELIAALEDVRKQEGCGSSEVVFETERGALDVERVFLNPYGHRWVVLS